MTFIACCFLFTSLSNDDFVPYISFVPSTGSTHRKFLYQGNYRYLVELDQYGRPCPIGLYGDAAKSLDEMHSHDLVGIDVRSKGYFEFHSGRLVYYTVFDSEADNKTYVPDLSRSVISIDEYLRGKEISPWRVHDHREVFAKKFEKSEAYREVFYLPGFFKAVGNPGKRSLSERWVANYPKQPAPFTAQKPAHELKLRFDRDSSQRFAIRFRQLIYIVTIDPVTGRYFFENFAEKIDAASSPRPALPPWLLLPKVPNESVYEIRHNRLIPGFLHEIGTEEWIFIPDLGGTIVEANEYLKTYQPWSRRIYNLPGKFVPTTEK